MLVSEAPAAEIAPTPYAEWNPYGNFLTVRHLDAHAWLEFWRAGDGCVRLDPTSAVSPPSSTAPNTAGTNQ